MVEYAMAGEVSYVYAGFWWRVVAALIDFVVLLVAQTILEVAGLGPAGIVVTWLYFALFESSEKRGTPGKMACGLIVTDLGGGRIGFGRATGRFFAQLLSGTILMIGYLMAAFTQRKQGLHDMIAGTLVLRAEPPAAGVAMSGGAGPPPVVR